MAATYLEITNELLRELNEVALTSATFAGAIGVQQHIKDCGTDHILILLMKNLNGLF